MYSHAASPTPRPPAITTLAPYSPATTSPYCGFECPSCDTSTASPIKRAPELLWSRSFAAAGWRMRSSVPNAEPAQSLYATISSCTAPEVKSDRYQRSHLRCEGKSEEAAARRPTNCRRIRTCYADTPLVCMLSRHSRPNIWSNCASMIA